MKPGQVNPSAEPAPASAPSRRARVTVRNTGRFPAYLGSHFALRRASAALELDRDAVLGARPDLPAGATARIGAGETVDLDVIWD